MKAESGIPKGMSFFHPSGLVYISAVCYHEAEEAGGTGSRSTEEQIKRTDREQEGDSV